MSVPRIDFYQLSRDPVDISCVKLARKVMQSGARLLVVGADEAQLSGISQLLWAQDGAAFLAHGFAGEPHAERQPILLSGECEAINGARMAVLADGVWREDALGFDRVLLLFGADQRGGAADLWRRFAGDANIDNRIHKQDETGVWREGR